MLIVRGVNIFPQQIERVLMATPQVGRNYVIIIEGLDDMTVKVELAAAGFDGEVEHLASLHHQLVEKLKAEIWVKPKSESCRPVRCRWPKAKPNGSSTSDHCKGAACGHCSMKSEIRNPKSDGN